MRRMRMMAWQTRGAVPIPHYCCSARCMSYSVDLFCCSRWCKCRPRMNRCGSHRRGSFQPRWGWLVCTRSTPTRNPSCAFSVWLVWSTVGTTAESTPGQGRPTKASRLRLLTPAKKPGQAGRSPYPDTGRLNVRRCVCGDIRHHRRLAVDTALLTAELTVIVGPSCLVSWINPPQRGGGAGAIRVAHLLAHATRG